MGTQGARNKQAPRLYWQAACFFCIVYVACPSLLYPQRGQIIVKLPNPVKDGPLSVEAALHSRKSIRSFSDEPITLEELGQLLWAAQGITRDNFFRTTPSAGALYPLEFYVVAGKVTGLKEGIYHYSPQGNQLRQLVNGDRRLELCAASLRQDCIAQGAVDLIVAGVYKRTAVKYGSRAHRYVQMEAGHAAENIYLQAASLGLGTVVVGAFDDDRVRQVVPMEEDAFPLCIMPVGRPQ